MKKKSEASRLINQQRHHGPRHSVQTGTCYMLHVIYPHIHARISKHTYLILLSSIPPSTDSTLKKKKRSNADYNKVQAEKKDKIRKEMGKEDASVPPLRRKRQTN